MTMFQIDGAAQDPVTRYVAFCPLICSLISLLHGCMFIVRFSTMRKVSRAAEWALVRILSRHLQSTMVSCNTLGGTKAPESLLERLGYALHAPPLAHLVWYLSSPQWQWFPDTDSSNEQGQLSHLSPVS